MRQHLYYLTVAIETLRRFLGPIWTEEREITHEIRNTFPIISEEAAEKRGWLDPAKIRCEARHWSYDGHFIAAYKIGKRCTVQRKLANGNIVTAGHASQERLQLFKRLDQIAVDYGKERNEYRDLKLDASEAKRLIAAYIKLQRKAATPKKPRKPSRKRK